MATKKITLIELKSLVKNIIKEESGIPLKDKIINYLKSMYGSEFDEFAAEAALYWYGYNYHEGQYSDLYKIVSSSNYKPSRLINDIDDADDIAQMYYNDILSEFENISEYGDETMNESQLNEISSDTFKSAVDKSNKAGSDKRIDRLSKLYFNEFIGYKVLDGRIKEITAVSGDEIAIIVHMGNEKDKTFYYAYTKDDFSRDGTPMDRKSAVVFSKIFKKINPDTKYKSVGSTFKLSDNFNESKTIKLSEVRQLVRSIIKEEKIIKESKGKSLNSLLKYYGISIKENKKFKTEDQKVSLYFDKMPIFNFVKNGDSIKLKLQEDPLLNSPDNHYVEKLGKTFKKNYEFDLSDEIGFDKFDEFLKRVTDKLLN